MEISQVLRLFVCGFTVDSPHVDVLHLDISPYLDGL